MKTPPNDGRGGGTIVLVTVLLSTLLLPLSLTGASVALPDIQRGLGVGLTSAQWVVNSYNACFAAFLVSAGSIADAVGRRRVYAFGVALFFVCGLLCLLVQDIGALVALRALGGAGAAAAVAGGGSMLALTFEGPARARAFGLLGTVLGAGTAFGPAVAGLLVENLGWRFAFAGPALVAGLVLLLVTRVPAMCGDGRSVDWLGGALFTAALLSLIGGLVEGPSRGLPALVAFLVPAVVLFGLFVVVERRRQEPLVDVGLLANRRFVAYALAAATFMSVLVPLLVYLPSYLINVVGLGPGTAGLWLLFLTVPTLLLPAVGAELANRLPHTGVVVGALLLLGAGVLGFTTLGPDATPWSVLLPFLLVGTGVGLTGGMIDGLGLGAVPPERVGTAAGVFNATRLSLETVSIAAVGAALAVLTGGRLDGPGFTGALHGVALVLVGFVLLVVLAVLALTRTPRARVTTWR
ncbi:MFS transporter [Nocardiopsis ganjiahuensis]|uniref:MFS transporter n=1 Tax=Nocardiopsis ganjiahuensis TaxID=239984 RepID=UPI000346302E|nr:MFS transporter [Nocardiopsis ganjiahuensis]